MKNSVPLTYEEHLNQTPMKINNHFKVTLDYDFLANQLSFPVLTFRDKLCNKAIIGDLSLREYDHLRSLIPADILVNDYVNNHMADKIRESLKDGE